VYKKIRFYLHYNVPYF